MKVGKLRNRVQIQRNMGTERTAIGEIKDGWSTIATVWARIEPKTGREAWEGAQTQGLITHDITIRGTDIMHNDRILDEKNHLYEVVSVFVDNNIDHVTIAKCKEKNTNSVPE